LTAHGFIEYLRYKWKAKSRHGIHSPFVYAFVEEVIQDRGKIVITNVFEFPFLPAYYTPLASRIVAYYHYQSIAQLPAKQSDDAVSVDVAILPAEEPELWISLLKKYFHLLKKDAVVFVPDIHKTAARTREWGRLCDQPESLVSIDLYGIGLLFFKEEFKEKQHFVLKC
jgi:hypothetical protein